MNKSLLIFLFTCLCICACRQPSSEPSRSAEVPNNIVFLMGHDKWGSSYFQHAEEYYRTNDSAENFMVVHHCKTLADVINYLNAEDTIFKTIDIVAHGNAATGLNLYLSEGGYKATPKRMVQEVILRDLPRLTEGVVDSSSTIRVWSCGIGENLLVAHSLPLILKPEIGPYAHVECSKHFVVFKPDQEGVIQRYAAAYYPYQYKRGLKPALSIIALNMQNRFPEVDINWSDAIADDNNFIDYHLPISFTRTYINKEDRPDIGIEKQQLMYVRDQPEIRDQLDEIDMDYDDFSWSVSKRKELQDDGTYTFCIKAVGMTTLLCFLDIAE
ncbi:MAG: hypothetical protein ACI9RU_001612 [Litorivivens sp.]|jgi:hypothetical protein